MLIARWDTRERWAANHIKGNANSKFCKNPMKLQKFKVPENLNFGLQKNLGNMGSLMTSVLNFKVRNITLASFTVHLPYSAIHKAAGLTGPSRSIIWLVLFHCSTIPLKMSHWLWMGVPGRSGLWGWGGGISASGFLANGRLLRSRRLCE